MKKRFLSVLICLFLAVSVIFPVYGSELPRVVDEADLLTEEEEIILASEIYELWNSCELDIVILTVETTGGESVQTYADDYYDEHGYGYGNDGSGMLLLLCMDTREWYISTCGEAIYIFTDYGLEQMGEDMLPYLSAGMYYEGFDSWLDQIPEYCDAFADGTPVDGYAPPDDYYSEYGDEIVYYPYESEPNPVMNFFIALVIGLVAATVSILVMRSKINTAKAQSDAVSYVKYGTYNLNIQRDMFLYRSMTKTPKAQNNGGSRGGGSSVHRSSGGRSHGGRGGRF